MWDVLVPIDLLHSLSAEDFMAGTMVVFGDSITFGHNVTPGRQYKFRVSEGLNRPIVHDFAANNNCAADQAQFGLSVPPEPDQLSLIMVGLNDARIYGDDRVLQHCYERFLRRLIADRFLARRVVARDGIMQKAGYWWDVEANSIGMTSEEGGASARTEVSGRSIYIGHIIQDHPASRGVADIYVDGVKTGTVSSDGTAGCTTAQGLSYGPALTRFDGFADGSHEVEVRVVTPGARFRLDYVAGSDQPDGPAVLLSDIVRLAERGYDRHGYDKYGRRDERIAVYNTIVAKVAEEFLRDGFDIQLVGIHASMDPNVDAPDGIHPGDDAQAKLAECFLEAARQ